MIKRLEVQGFRNYDNKKVELGRGVNLIIGKNGSGKTNLLEAAFFLICGKSMRRVDVKEMVGFGKEGAVVEGTLEINFQREIRRIISGEEKRSLEQRVDEMEAVSFHPDDIWIIKGSPEMRRRAIDEAITQVKRGYGQLLREYGRILRQRNEALRKVRKKEESKNYIRSLNPLLCDRGRNIVEERSSLIDIMEEKIREISRRWEGMDIELNYYSTLGLAKAEQKDLMEKLERVEDAEIRRGITLVGPHRDEMVVRIGGKNARRECSQGEQKIATILWVLAKAVMTMEIVGKETVLLMDDCLSELDTENRERVLRELERWNQSFVTATELPDEMGTYNVILLGDEAGERGRGQCIE